MSAEFALASIAMVAIVAIITLGRVIMRMIEALDHARPFQDK